MKSGGVKFWLRKRIVAMGGFAFVVGILCLGQTNADENGKPVRFKLSESGDSGKLVVQEKTPENRDGNRVFDNSLRFKRDENGNISRIGDFKEITPGAVRAPAKEVVTEKSVDSVTGLPMLADVEIMNLMPPKWEFPKLELPDLNLFFGTSSAPLVNENGDVPEAIEQQAQVEEPMDSPMEDMIPMDLPMEDVIEREAEKPEDADTAKKPETEKASNSSIFNLPTIDLGLAEFFGLSSDDDESTEDAEPVEPAADNEGSDETVDSTAANASGDAKPEAAPSTTSNALLPELPSLETLFPKLGWSGFEEVFDGIGTAYNETDTRKSAAPSLKINPRQKVQRSTDASADAEPVPAKNETPMPEFGGVVEDNPAEKNGVTPMQQDESPLDQEVRSAAPSIHRAPGRKALGNHSQAAKRSPSTNSNSYNLFSDFKIPNFKIPEFNNPFNLGSDEQGSQEAAANKPVQIPGLKKPTVPSPDSGILEVLPELSSERPSVPGLKLMNSKAPKTVPMVDPQDGEDTEQEGESQDESELGSGIPMAPVADDADKELVDPDKILTEFEKK